MNQLNFLQSVFQDFLLNGNQSIASEISAINDMQKNERLAIYYDGYRLRLIESLTSDYEVVKNLLGEDTFNESCLEYIHQFPSTFRSVRYFGEQYPNFLKTTSPYNEKPVLAEMAQFEWLLGNTMDAKDFTPLTLDELKKIPADKWPYLVFHLQPALFFMECQYNTPQIWKEIDTKSQESTGTETETETETNITPIKDSKTWIVWRKGIMAHYQSLSDEEAVLLSGVQKGLNFADLCELLTNYHEEEKVPTIAVAYISKWIQLHLLENV